LGALIAYIIGAANLNLAAVTLIFMLLAGYYAYRLSAGPDLPVNGGCGVWNTKEM